MPKIVATYWRPLFLVFLPFSAGYFLSYFFRTINAVLATALTNELGLNVSELGLMTAVYFLTFAIIQLPLGILLDRYGPRRVQGLLLFVTAAGAALFASANRLDVLIVARALIGLGAAGALIAGLKAIVSCFPKERVPLLNGWFVMLGTLGAVAATSPAEWLLGYIEWRTLLEAGRGRNGHGRRTHPRRCSGVRSVALQWAEWRLWWSRHGLSRPAFLAPRATLHDVHQLGLGDPRPVG